LQPKGTHPSKSHRPEKKQITRKGKENRTKNHSPRTDSWDADRKEKGGGVRNPEESLREALCTIKAHRVDKGVPKGDKKKEKTARQLPEARGDKRAGQKEAQN